MSASSYNSSSGWGDSGATICGNATTTNCPYCLKGNQPVGPREYWWWDTGRGQSVNCLCNNCVRTMPGRPNEKNQTIYLEETGIHRMEREQLGFKLKVRDGK